jgi:hypothetical protein
MDPPPVSMGARKSELANSAETMSSHPSSSEPAPEEPPR